MPTLVFIYERAQVTLLEEFLSSQSDRASCTVVALDAEVEHVLTKRGIAFESGGRYRSPDAQPMLLADEWAEKLLSDERWGFFAYKGVSFAGLYRHPLQSYLLNLLYFADLVANAVAAHPTVGHLVVFPPQTAGPSIGSVLVDYKIRVVVDAVETVGGQNGKEVLVAGKAPEVRAQSRPLLFTVKRTCFGATLAVLNLLVCMLRRPRHIRILASDYWKHLAPYIQNLDTEVILIDRTEALSAGLRAIWKYRMRFVHLYMSHRTRERTEVQETFMQEAGVLTQVSDSGAYVFRGYSFWPLLRLALCALIENAYTHALAEVDAAHVLLTSLKPDVVLLRSTISTQRHFFILAAVARALGVPSLEMQHGLEYYGPGAVDRPHSAEYMGVYGQLTAREMQAAGDDCVKPVVIGSPRFDVYASTQKKHAALQPGASVSLLCIAPPTFPGLLSAYDGLDYFAAVASAVRDTPNLSVLIKIRPGVSPNDPVHTVIATLFTGLPYAVVQREPLWELYPKSDIVVTHYSTTVLEALMSHRPVVYLGLAPAQQTMADQQFGPYVEAGVMRVAKSSVEFTQIVQMLVEDSALRGRMGGQAGAFIEREYAFDGRASERAAGLIRRLAKK